MCLLSLRSCKFLPDLDSVVYSVLSALTSKLYFSNVFCTSAISANSNPIKSTSSAYAISVCRVFFQYQKSVLARRFSLLSGRFLSIWKIKRDLDYLPVASIDLAIGKRRGKKEIQTVYRPCYWERIRIRIFSCPNI